MSSHELRSDHAHAFRRLTFGPFPGQLDAVAAMTFDELVSDLMGRAPVAVADDPPEQGNIESEPLVDAFVDALVAPEAGLHERMVWFWHGHFTASYDKVDIQEVIWRQYQLTRKYALGNFRDFLRAMTLDAAMLLYLDGNESKAEAPNENFAREVMELFALGVGHYTEDDVRSAALALTGYWFDWEEPYGVHFESEVAHRESVQLFGKSVRGVDGVVDAICNHPMIGDVVVRKLHLYFIGSEPSDERADELRRVFVESDLEIRPLVEAVLFHADFLASKFTRNRTALEWLLPVASALEMLDEITAWDMEVFGQVPFLPPNVAGWPMGDRWVSPSQFLSRAFLFDYVSISEAIASEINGGADPVNAVLNQFSIVDVTQATRSALQEVARSFAADEPEEILRGLLTVVVLCPEMTAA